MKRATCLPARLGWSLQEHEPKLANSVAWQKALAYARRPRATPESRQRAALLAKALCSWSAWLPSSCQVEANFSQVQRVHGARLQCLGDCGKQDLLTLVVERPTPANRKKLIGEAQEIYVANFGKHRAFGRPRATRKLGKKPANGTEASFLRRRNQQIGSLQQRWLAKKRNMDWQKRAGQRAASSWGEAATNELSFQRAKRRKLLERAASEGQLVRRRAPPASSDQRQKVSDKRMQDHLRKQTVLRKVPFKFGGSNIFAGKATQLSAPQQEYLEKTGLKVVRERASAQAFLVQDVGTPGQLNLWHVVLQGGTLVSAEWLESRGHRGKCLTYRPAVKKACCVWFSQAFCSRHPTLVGIIEAATKRKGSLWTLFAGGQDEFLLNNPCWRRRRRLGFIHLGDRARCPGLARATFCHTAAEFLERHASVDIKGTV